MTVFIPFPKSGTNTISVYQSVHRLTSESKDALSFHLVVASPSMLEWGMLSTMLSYHLSFSRFLKLCFPRILRGNILAEVTEISLMLFFDLFSSSACRRKFFRLLHTLHICYIPFCIILYQFYELRLLALRSHQYFQYPYENMLDTLDLDDTSSASPCRFAHIVYRAEIVSYLFFL